MNQDYMQIFWAPQVDLLPPKDGKISFEHKVYTLTTEKVMGILGQSFFSIFSYAVPESGVVQDSRIDIYVGSKAQKEMWGEIPYRFMQITWRPSRFRLKSGSSIYRFINFRLTFTSVHEDVKLGFSSIDPWEV